ncbi:hypothetical protein CYLTODRAFT_447317 [Cylindrobasidium torrendii FP15055 ss-10]|uniref:Uncharacterized protein n=1 Tax=Cylindrobasidium torrendii FP15055 ss-10 TaxID=1314674 RepID=A0A0D7AVL7_9AGAR|nr:hypothetical protein CYLTODRAFT_447317 [Cylindrobasidium torrendii FP15055 ss-10]
MSDSSVTSEAIHRRGRTLPRLEFALDVDDEELVAVKIADQGNLSQLPEKQALVNTEPQDNAQQLSVQDGATTMEVADDSLSNVAIFKNPKMMKSRLGSWWESSSSAPLVEPPACPLAMVRDPDLNQLSVAIPDASPILPIKPRTIPSAGDVYVHHYGSDRRQLWVRSVKQMWDILPDDAGIPSSGVPQEDWPRHPRHPRAPYMEHYLVYPKREDSRPNWVKWATIQLASKDSKGPGSPVKKQ